MEEKLLRLQSLVLNNRLLSSLGVDMLASLVVAFVISFFLYLMGVPILFSFIFFLMVSLVLYFIVDRDNRRRRFSSLSTNGSSYMSDYDQVTGFYYSDTPSPSVFTHAHVDHHHHYPQTSEAIEVSNDSGGEDSYSSCGSGGDSSCGGGGDSSCGGSCD